MHRIHFARRILAAFLLTTIFLLVSCRNVQSPDDAETSPAASQEVTVTGAALPVINIYTLNIGKADCILIRTPNHLVIIDAGESETKNTVVDSIKATGTKTADYLILTHFDNDHIGGAPKILKKNTVLNVIMPDYVRDSDDKRDLDDELTAGGHTPVILSAENYSFSLDGADFTVYPPLRNDYPPGDEYDNMMSLVITMKYGNTNFLFAGDAVGERLAELSDQLPDAAFDFIKIPHHGNFDSFYSYSFLTRFQPAAAIITCSGSQRPDGKLLKCLSDLNTATYLTLSGTVTAATDGLTVTIRQ